MTHIDNKLHARRAERAIDAYRLIGEFGSREGLSTDMIDMLSDLRHLAKRDGEDFDDAVRISGTHFEAELADVDNADQWTDGISFDYTEGQIVKLFHGRPADAHFLTHAPANFMLDALRWNDPHTDYSSTDYTRDELFDLVRQAFNADEQDRMDGVAERSRTGDQPLDPPGYAALVREFEEEGMTTSDAQGCADVHFAKQGMRS